MESNLLSLISSLPGVIYRCRNDLQRTMMYLSPGCLTVFGYPAEIFLDNAQMAFSEMVLPEDRQQVWEQIQRAVNAHQPYQVVYRIKRSDNKVRWILDQGRALYEQEENVITLEGYISDITDLKQREEELEIVTSLSHALRGARSRFEVYPVILGRLSRYLGASGCLIAIWQPSAEEIVIERGTGAFEPLAGHRVPMGSGILGWVISSGQIFLADQLSTSFDPLFAAHSNSIRALVSVPLIDHEVPFGALAIGRQEAFGLSEVSVVNAIADITAVTLRRVSLMEQTEKRLSHMSALRTIETAINANLDLRFTLNILVDQVIHRLSIDAADLWLYYEENQRLTYGGGYGFRTLSIKTMPLQLEHSLPGLVAKERKILRIPDLRNNAVPALHPVPLEDEGFVAYWGIPLISRDRLHGVLELFNRKPLNLESEQVEFLESLVSTTAIAIDNARLIEDLRRANAELVQAYDETILGWSLALEMRDSSTENHTRRVTEMTVRLAQAMGISGDELTQVRRGAILHDIGKMAIPDHILRKTGPLTEEEAAIMRLHPLFARQMLEAIAFLRPALAIPTYHHERWDGTGYPFGLKGEEIPLPARIFAVVDVWDALRHDRAYRSAWPEEQVRAYIREAAGTHFDPCVVEVFLRLLDEFKGEIN